MLRHEDFVREFPVVHRNDRDSEAVILLEFLKDKAPFKSLLDIGGFKSAAYYAETLRGLADRYDSIDILADPAVEAICDNYYQANANEFDFDTKYEIVICVSTIEHAGSQTYKADPKTEQMTMFKRALELSSKYVWISFPVGQPWVYPDELSIITDPILKSWEALIKPYKVKKRFLYNQGAQAGHPWFEHKKRDVAVKIPYIDYIGNQSICVLEIEK